MVTTTLSNSYFALTLQTGLIRAPRRHAMHTLSDDELTLLLLSHVELFALAERFNVSLHHRSILSIINAIIKAKKKQEKKN